ncbi:WSC-domain protein [Mollisia scopiformis]|uniref:WSC-domain protein n=1 Tax=Mollisia scopiformis TaxID=149040 RepID=A0A194XC77_MOLSC|nr:WSC-domain protein [Mollisia scopiformis]KUJ17770.1 WSC-domain protein [Mollisia scopiformis]
MASKYLQQSVRAILVLSLLSLCSAGKSLTPASALPGTWSYQGCWVDIPGRTLSGASFSNSSMTDELCVNYCNDNQYIYAGTEYTSQCFCGPTIASSATQVNSTTDCNMPCAGSSSEPCGGINRLSLFWSGDSPPSTNPGPGPWSLVGCYTEGVTGRTLPNQVTTPGGPASLTVALCTTACQAAGYVLAGVEYSQQCWCGDTFSNGGVPAPEGLSGCDMLCSGNLSEYCGGPNRLGVYDLNNAIATITTTTVSPTATAAAIKPTISPYTYYGCQTEATGVRALSANTTASDSMTLEMCEEFCYPYSYFGVEYGRECYCGNRFNAGSNATIDSECSFRCPGNTLEFCGAGNLLSCYQLQ